MLTTMYVYLDYEQYKKFEEQLKQAKEDTHWTEEGYHKSFRIKIGELTLEIHGPLVRVQKKV